jgi:hypothetical protein
VLNIELLDHHNSTQQHNNTTHNNTKRTFFLGLAFSKSSSLSSCFGMFLVFRVLGDVLGGILPKCLVIA